MAPRSISTLCAALILLAGGQARADEPSPENRPATLDPVSVSVSESHETDSSTAAPSPWETFEQNFKLSGFIRQETAYRVGHSGEFTKVRQQLLLTESSRLSDDLRLKATERVWYDAVYDATDNFSESAEHSQRWLGELRDTYLDYSHGPFDVRVGKQQIVWGDAVGLFFADVVNAKDLREYILPDFDLIRIPQWALDFEYQQDPVHAEFVWLPVREFHRLPVSGSEFEFPLPIPEGAFVNYTDPSKPPASFSDSEVGGRLSYLVNGWDMSGFYLYSWDKFPVLFRRISGSTYIFEPEYRRANYFGGSFSKDLNVVVLKGELLINPASYLVTFDPTDANGIVRRPTADYLLGVDHTFGTIETNVQLMQRWVVNHPQLLKEDELRTHLSFWVKTNLLDGKLTPEFLVIAGIGNEDILYRPKVTVNVTDALQVRFGADVFQGDPQGLFGQFNDHSRVYTEVTYHF